MAMAAKLALAANACRNESGIENEIQSYHQRNACWHPLLQLAGGYGVAGGVAANELKTAPAGASAKLAWRSFSVSQRSGWKLFFSNSQLWQLIAQLALASAERKLMANGSSIFSWRKCISSIWQPRSKGSHQRWLWRNGESISWNIAIHEISKSIIISRKK